MVRDGGTPVIENKVSGLFQGPVDHNAGSVVNAVYDTTSPGNFALIGDSVFIQSPPNDGLLPEVNFIFGTGLLFYGVVVGGDQDGIYPETGDDFVFDVDDPAIVALSGDTVRVCTQGRCIAGLDNDGISYNVGDPLKAADGGQLVLATSGSLVVARALQQLDAVGGFSIGFIAVDIQREGILP